MYTPQKLVKSETKKLSPSPSPRVRQVVVDRLVKDIQHPPRSKAGKIGLLTRLAKFLKSPPYKAQVVITLLNIGYLAKLTHGAYSKGKQLGGFLPQGFAAARNGARNFTLRWGGENTNIPFSQSHLSDLKLQQISYYVLSLIGALGVGVSSKKFVDLLNAKN